jgi:hypothetical protein
MPGLRRQRRQQQPAAHQRHAKLHHRARSEAVHHAPDQRTGNARRHEAERKRAGCDAAVPAELADDRRIEQRERGARIDAECECLLQLALPRGNVPAKSSKECKRNARLAVDRLNAVKHDFLCNLYEDILSSERPFLRLDFKEVQVDFGGEYSRAAHAVAL